MTDILWVKRRKTGEEELHTVHGTAIGKTYPASSINRAKTEKAFWQLVFSDEYEEMGS